MPTPTLVKQSPLKPSPGASVPKPAEATPAPPKLKRRPFLVVLAVVFIGLGALLGAYLTTLGDAHPVVAMRHDVPRGAEIGHEDLIEARINADPALKTIPADQISLVIGKRAKVDLAAGGLVSMDNLTDDNIPAQGQTLVGVALSAAQMPGHSLSSGDRVRVIHTPRAQDDPPERIPDAVHATVIAQRTHQDTGITVVDVSVPSADAANLAALVATGRVGLVLDGMH